MKLSVKVATTSKTINVFIRDSSSTTGGGLTGLVYNTASLTCYYALPRAAAVSVTLATLAAVTSAYSSGGFKEIDATNMPGWYRFDVPDAALASGAFVDLHFKGATNMAPTPVEIELTAVDNQDAVRMGLTALPNAAAEAAGGLYTRGTGAGQINQTNNGQIDANAARLGGITQTGRDLGASVLLSNGTGTGQLKLASGYVAMTLADVAAPTTTINFSGTTIKTAADVETDTQDVQSRLPAALTGAGNMKSDALAISGDSTAADNAESFFDGTGYAGTNNVIPLVTTVTTLTNLPTIPANWLTAAGLATDAVTEIVNAINAAVIDVNILSILDTNATDYYTDAAIGSVSEVGVVAGDVQGKVLGGGASTIAGTGVRAVDSSGNAIAPASTALSNVQWTNTLSTDLGTMATRFLTMISLDGSVYQFTTNALELAPSGGGGGGSLTTEQNALIQSGTEK